MAPFRWLPGKHLPQLERLEDRCLPSVTADPFGQLPLTFEANQGQTDAQVRFLARGPGYALFLNDTEADLHLHQGEYLRSMKHFMDRYTVPPPVPASVAS